jgi:hypothetical protein
MPIIEAILYFCEECQTVSLEGGICINCDQPLQSDIFVPKSAHSAHLTDNVGDHNDSRIWTSADPEVRGVKRRK